MNHEPPMAQGPVDRRVSPLEIAAALRAYQQGDMDGVMVLVSRQACEEGAEWLERLNRETEVLYHEREQVRARMDNAVRLLTGIHALLYPPRTTDNDGRTWEFHSPMVHEQMQELSDRIRALPDELARIERPNVVIQGAEPLAAKAPAGMESSTP